MQWYMYAYLFVKMEGVKQEHHTSRRGSGTSVFGSTLLFCKLQCLPLRESMHPSVVMCCVLELCIASAHYAIYPQCEMHGFGPVNCS